MAEPAKCRAGSGGETRWAHSGGCTLVALARRCFRRRWPGFYVAWLYVPGCVNDSTTLGTCAAIDGVTVATGGLEGD